MQQQQELNPFTVFKQSLRIAKAEMLFLKQKNESIEKGLNQNKFGCICLKATKYKMAEKHFKEALQTLTIELQCPVTNILMNLGNMCAEQKLFEQAVEFYKQVVTLSPYANEKEFIGVVWSNKLNSYEAYVDAHTNLAGILSNLDKSDQAYEYCLKAIKLQPDNCEAQINLGDLLRQLGKQEEAIHLTWEAIERHTNQESEEKYQIPTKINIKEVQSEHNELINIICMKWGTKYGSNYVNKLFQGFQRHSTKPFNFICVTDDASDLMDGIMSRELQKGWKGWWGKATLFMDYNYPPGKLFFIDLDMIITGNIDEILGYNGEFGILKTDDLACEKQNKNGYNSSIMIWNNRKVFQKVFIELDKNWKNISKFIVRFDFWLEMMIENADYLQDIYPNQISDFVKDCQQILPQNTRIVCFPRMPKPDTYPAEWIKEHWI